jgi:hypothetical protein
MPLKVDSQWNQDSQSYVVIGELSADGPRALVPEGKMVGIKSSTAFASADGSIKFSMELVLSDVVTAPTPAPAEVAAPPTAAVVQPPPADPTSAGG